MSPHPVIAQPALFVPLYSDIPKALSSEASEAAFPKRKKLFTVDPRAVVADDDADASKVIGNVELHRVLSGPVVGECWSAPFNRDAAGAVHHVQQAILDGRAGLNPPVMLERRSEIRRRAIVSTARHNLLDPPAA